MNKQITLNDFLNELKKNMVIASTIPMGYIAGLPIVQMKKKKVCLIIPYFNFVRSGETDKSLIHPIKFTVTVLWRSGRVIKMEDMEYDPRFENVDFQKPIGLFRHEAIKQYNAGQYREKKSELFEMYDKLIGFLQDGGEYSAQDEEDFKALFNVILEPSLVPIYKALDPKFAAKFIEGDTL
jgi:hypothetical protein